MRTIWGIYKVIAVISFIALVLALIGAFAYHTLWVWVLVPLWHSYGWWTVPILFSITTVLVGFGLVTDSREIRL